MNKIQMYVKKYWHYLGMIAWTIIWYIVVCIVRTPYFPGQGTDTVTYQITSLGELSWSHRLPGYQMICLLFYNLAGREWENADKYIVIFQICIAVIGNILFYDALYKYLHSKKGALLFGVANMMIIAMFGWSDYILTESLALSIMCILIWILVQAVETRKSRFFILLSIISLCGIMIRPSFIFLLPCLAIFFVCFYIADDRKLAGTGLLALLLVTCVILAYCQHNKLLIGKFCLSDVSYHNGLASLIAGDMYDNPEYPEITEFIRTELADKDTNCLFKAFHTFDSFGYDIGAEYIKDTQQLHWKEYLNYIKNNAIQTAVGPLVECVSEIGPRVQYVYEALKVILFPWSFVSLIFWTILYLGYIIYRSINEKRFYYVDFGIVACILSIYILSLVTLYEAALQRIAVCLIPCTFFLEALIFKQLIGGKRQAF